MGHLLIVLITLSSLIPVVGCGKKFETVEQSGVLDSLALTPDPQVGVSESPPVFNSVTFYNTNCATCHTAAGAPSATIEYSTKKSATRALLDGAIANINDMKRFSTLTSQQRNEIIASLNALINSGKTVAEIPPRIVRLSSLQFKNTLVELLPSSRVDVFFASRDLPFATESASLEFSTIADPLRVTEYEFEKTWNLASDLSGEMITALRADGTTCVGRNDYSNGCLRTLFSEKGEKIFRRPLTSDELDGSNGVAGYLSLFTSMASTEGNEKAVGAVFMAMMLSPYSFFRTELGGAVDGSGKTSLTAIEMASLLSYGIANRPPDKLLMDLAKGTSQPLSQAAVRSEVKRLLGNMSERESIQTFVAEYFGYDQPYTGKPDVAFFNFDDLKDDTNRLVSHMLSIHGKNQFFENLMNTTKVYAKPETAVFYGLTNVPEGGRIYDLTNGTRRGLFSQPSWLSAYSHLDENNLVGRGKRIRLNFLCGTIPPLPPEVDVTLPIDPNLTLRRKMEAHTQGSCRDCHSKMDPLGFPFENFNHLGQFRQNDVDGLPVNGTGDIDGIAVADFRAMADQLSQSLQVKKCILAHFTQYWLGIPIRPESTSAIVDELYTSYVTSGGSFEEIMSSLYATELSRSRQTTND